MAKTLKQKVEEYRSKYKYVSNHRYFYNEKRDLNKKLTSIVGWFIVESTSRGVAVLEFEFKRSKEFSIAQWAKLITDKVNDYQPILSIVRNEILPNIGERYKTKYRLIDMIGWTDAIYKSYHSEFSKSNKTKATKNVKRNKRSRRRHRNSKR